MSIHDTPHMAKMNKRFIPIKQISDTMCMAKWLQTTIYLYLGKTHSCHHTPKHSISPTDLMENKSALHNTQQKMWERQQLLDGKQPEPCNYCWNIENQPGGHLSDRFYKSTDSWAFPYAETVKQSGLGETIDPTYLEVSFSHVCNFKCLYCSPDVSSQWVLDSTNFGKITLPSGQNMHDLDWLKQINSYPISPNDPNPYLDAFWEWFPQLYPKLHVFRVTGGEPLLSKDTWKIIEYIKAHPNPNLTVAFNTNLGVDDALIETFISEIEMMSTCVKEVQIFTSADGYGKQNDYVRQGMVYDTWKTNVSKVLDNTSANVTMNMMITANALSSYSFDMFLMDMLEFKRRFNNPEGPNIDRFLMTIAYLRWPNFFTTACLPHPHKLTLTKQWREFMVKHSRLGNPTIRGGRFYGHEIDQLDRLIEWMLNNDHFDKHRDDLVAYLTEVDRRSVITNKPHLNHREIFPELCQFLYP